MSDFIREQLVVLVNTARLLNGELHAEAQSSWPTSRPDWATEQREARAQAVAVVEAALGAEYPAIPRAALAAFDALAEGQSLEYAGSKINYRGPWLLQPDYRTPIRLVGRSARGWMAAWLALYFLHPYRDRLRRCQQCARWFVDMARNKSARRCSKACTVAWSNKQRAKGGQ